jgi:hypothetical protein
MPLMPLPSGPDSRSTFCDHPSYRLSSSSCLVRQPQYTNSSGRPNHNARPTGPHSGWNRMRALDLIQDLGAVGIHPGETVPVDPLPEWTIHLPIGEAEPRDFFEPSEPADRQRPNPHREGHLISIARFRWCILDSHHDRRWRDGFQSGRTQVKGSHGR